MKTYMEELHLVRCLELCLRIFRMLVSIIFVLGNLLFSFL
uniref:Uncharacterized protein n=1 Tax=Rhizophora mucronata TaxID=61149 RepID=A0A2P2L412_RHIMU